MDDRMQKESNFVSAVVYLHSCRAAARPFLEMVCGQLSAHFKRFEVICMDDASSDGTEDEVRALAGELEAAQFTLVRLSDYHGCEAAMLAGMELAIGDYVFEFDSVTPDFDPALILEVYRRALQGYDVVSAAPQANQRQSSKLFYRVFNRCSSSPYQLRTERFRVLSRRVINRIHDVNQIILYRKVAYVTSGLKNDVILYSPLGRERSAIAREQQKHRRDMAVDSLIVFTDAAFKFSIAFSGVMAALAILAAVYTLVVFLAGHPVEGWTTTMLFLSAAFTGLFILLSILIKYASMIVRLQVRRKEYKFQSVEKL